MNIHDNCYFCNTESEMHLLGSIKQTRFVKCPVCGRYEVTSVFLKPEYKDMVAAYLYHHEKEKRENSDQFFYFLGDQNDFDNNVHNMKIPMRFVSLDEVKAFYPIKFSDKVKMSLLALAKKSRYFGSIITIPDEELLSLLFIYRFDETGKPLSKSQLQTQYNSIFKFFTKQQYLDAIGKSGVTDIQLLADGWKQIETLQVSNMQNKDVFVSMSFADSAKQTREAIKSGIVRAGFSPEFIDEIIHNRQIVPEMFRLIRECRFLILEISEPNYGAYYEAGYALGLGKEVIITCSAEVFSHKYESEEEKKYERYLKPHFDIAQKQILVWNNYDDLSQKLSEWIKALIR